ncbi:NADPH-dependent oxidoreductase [Cystobacter fuscus]|uniref:NADPH-dependent oxidoreductase n=1 Tax=Cystobacter fuscus TaxID=43 RepID=A0A250JE09_9BACT|nr:nitroreductase family protein [Cystobacter fuscus]ATB41747.1 NADPH-dependent oxidoreductase [Cystobacter fuscus]
MNAPNTSEKLLDLRYGEQDKPRNMRWNSTIEALLEHRSVRNYLPEPLPEGAIEAMVAAAQSASNSSNLHQWSVVVVTDVALKARIAECSRTSGSGNPYIEKAPALLLWVADLSRNNRIATADGQSAVVHEYLDALIMSTIDTALAAQNATIAAESLGLGVCYLGAMRNNAQAVAELIGLPRFSVVVFGLLVGVPDPSVPTRIRPRPSQAVVLHHNRYDVERSLRELASYEPAFAAFRAELGMNQKTWKDAARLSAVDMAYMDGRENLRGTVEQAGFKLR